MNQIYGIVFLFTLTTLGYVSSVELSTKKTVDDRTPPKELSSKTGVDQTPPKELSSSSNKNPKNPKSETSIDSTPVTSDKSTPEPAKSSDGSGFKWGIFIAVACILILVIAILSSNDAEDKNSPFIDILKKTSYQK